MKITRREFILSASQSAAAAIASSVVPKAVDEVAGKIPGASNNLEHIDPTLSSGVASNAGQFASAFRTEQMSYERYLEVVKVGISIFEGQTQVQRKIGLKILASYSHEEELSKIIRAYADALGAPYTWTLMKLFRWGLDETKIVEKMFPKLDPLSRNTLKTMLPFHLQTALVLGPKNFLSQLLSTSMEERAKRVLGDKPFPISTENKIEILLGTVHDVFPKLLDLIKSTAYSPFQTAWELRPPLDPTQINEMNLGATMVGIFKELKKLPGWPLGLTSNLLSTAAASSGLPASLAEFPATFGRQSIVGANQIQRAIDGKLKSLVEILEKPVNEVERTLVRRIWGCPLSEEEEVIWSRVQEDTSRLADVYAAIQQAQANFITWPAMSGIKACSFLLFRDIGKSLSSLAQRNLQEALTSLISFVLFVGPRTKQQNKLIDFFRNKPESFLSQTLLFLMIPRKYLQYLD